MTNEDNYLGKTCCEDKQKKEYSLEGFLRRRLVRKFNKGEEQEPRAQVNRLLSLHAQLAAFLQYHRKDKGKDESPRDT